MGDILVNLDFKLLIDGSYSFKSPPLLVLSLIWSKFSSTLLINF
jgi:hypothetical protein